MEAKKLLVKKRRVKGMSQKEVIRQNREATGLDAECRRQGQQMEAIYDIAEQRIKDELPTSK